MLVNSPYTIPAVVIGLAVIAAGALLVLVRARRAGLALHRELNSIRSMVESVQNSSGQLSQDVAVIRNEVQVLTDQFGNGMRVVTAQLGDVRGVTDQFGDEMRDIRARTTHLQEWIETVSGQVKDLAPAVKDITQDVQTLARRPLRLLPLDSRLIESANEQELIRLAESIAILRPLVPYPRWQYDAEVNNPDLAYQLRRWLWEHFHDRQSCAPFTTPWHANTRLRLFLGNDLSRQILVAGCFEPNEFAFLDRILQPGMTFLDAGANEGVYTVFAAKKVGPEGTVWAFEPSRREAERLQYNIDLNHLAARVFPLALADFSGEAELTVGEAEHAGQNTLGEFGHAGVGMAGKQTVGVRRLDDLLNENPLDRIDVLKLDVEGSELRLLRGALWTIERYRPYILFEVAENSLRHQHSSKEELLSFLQLQRYGFFAFDSLTGLPMKVSPDSYSDNMIGVPVEKPLPDSVYWPWPVPVRLP